MTLKILRTRVVTFDRGYAGFFPSQITEVKLGAVIGYVRENRRASSMESFVLSSNARLGHKADGDRIGVEVLELAAPKHAWDAIAAEVRALDTLRRPVYHSNRWTIDEALLRLNRSRS